MKLHAIEQSKVFVPKFGGNRELPEDEQIKVHIKAFPPASTLNMYRQITAGSQGYTVTYPKDTELIAQFVGRIEGLEVPQGKPRIFDGKTLAASDIREVANLIAEIRKYLLDGEEDLTPGEE